MNEWMNEAFRVYMTFFFQMNAIGVIFKNVVTLYNKVSFVNIS